MINITYVGIYEPIFINGIKTKYLVSEFADVISIHKGKVKRLKVYETKTKNKNKKGYLYVKLWVNGKSKAKFLHRLVAEAFIPNPYNKPEVNHKDGDKHNNLYYNLEWVTSKENKDHAKRMNLTNYASCENAGRSKYKNKDIELACKLLSENKYTIKKISKLSNVDIETLYNIRSKKIYNKISSKYTFPQKTVESNTNYDTKKIEEICILREKGYGPKEISKITSVKLQTVRDVIYHRRRKDISSKYNF